MTVKAKWRLFDTRGRLRHLARLLEEGEAIPQELAHEMATLLLGALEHDGKLNFGKQSGRPRTDWKKLNRAVAVAKLQITKNLEPADAIKAVADREGIKYGTVRKNVDECRDRAPALARHSLDLARWLEESAEELIELLATFRNETGKKLSGDEIEEIVGELPVHMIETYIGRIQNGSLRRDFRFLREVLEIPQQ